MRLWFKYIGHGSYRCTWRDTFNCRCRVLIRSLSVLPNCLCPMKRCRLSTPQSYSVSYDPHKNLLNDGGDKNLIVASSSLWVVVGWWPKEEVNYRWPLMRKSSRSVIVLSIAVAIDLIVLHIGELLRSGNGASAANYLDDVFSMQQQQQKPRRDREH